MIGEWEKYPLNDHQWSRRLNYSLVAYVERWSRESKFYDMERPWYWSIYHPGSLLVQGFAADMYSARSAAMNAVGDVESKILAAVRSLAIRRPFACDLCGQHILDGKPCGCGAR